MPAEIATLQSRLPRGFDMQPLLPSLTSPGTGREARQVYGRLKSLESLVPSSALTGVAPLRFEGTRELPATAPRTLPARTLSIEERLFQNRARLKILTSTVAMHLTEGTRNWLFEALDDLLSTEVWHEEDTLLSPGSFGTYLRLLTYQRGVKPGSLGVSNVGNLLAAWVSDDRRLTMEFLISDQVRWALSHGTGETRELAAGQCALKRLAAVLAPYDATSWFVEDAHSDQR